MSYFLLYNDQISSLLTDSAVLSKDNLTQVTNLVESTSQVSHYYEKLLYEQSEMEESIKEKAFQEGFKKGENDYKEKLSHALSSIFEAIEIMTKSLQEDSLEIAFETLTEIADDPNALNITARIAERITQKIDEKYRVSVIINDMATPTVEEKLSHLNRSIEIRPLPTVPLDTCIIETPFGRIEGSFSTQIEALYTAMKGALKTEGKIS